MKTDGPPTIGRRTVLSLIHRELGPGRRTDRGSRGRSGRIMTPSRLPTGTTVSFGWKSKDNLYTPRRHRLGNLTADVRFSGSIQPRLTVALPIASG